MSCVRLRAALCCFKMQESGDPTRPPRQVVSAVSGCSWLVVRPLWLGFVIVRRAATF
jgi:hypothetical protein